uniref:TRAP transporter small permease protein n=1 Tax=Marinomonas sp. (strain MWYL1) TaxID=400668 RepID=A6W050_MARMS
MWLSAMVNKHHGEFGLAKWLAFILELVSSLVLLALMLLTCSDVIGRYVFNNSVNGTTELTELALCIVVFCQLPIVTLTSAHVVVDILDRVLPAMFMKVSGLVINLGIAAGFFFLSERIWFQAARSLRRGVMTEFLHIPVAYFIQFIAIMMFVTGIILVLKALHSLLARAEVSE